MIRRMPIAWGIALASMVPACSAPATGPRLPEPLPPSCPETVPAPAPGLSVERVVIVTIDGLGSALLKDAPTVARLAGEGWFSERAQSVQPCLTLPAHVSMSTGVVPEEHGVVWNKFQRAAGPLRIPHLLRTVSESDRLAVLAAGKEKLRHLLPDNERVEWVARKLDDQGVMFHASGYLQQHDPALLWIHLPTVDRQGHAWGWGSPPQRAAVGRADGHVADLLDQLEELGRLDGTALILTADHGGHDHHHRAGTEKDLTVPWIVWARGLEPRRIGPVCVTETAKTALALLGLGSDGEADP